MSNHFVAGVQYDDLVGTAAADKADMKRFSDYLQQQGLVSASEHVYGYRICFSENHGHPMPSPGIVAYVLPEGVSGPQPSKVRSVEVRGITLADFFSFFKRFDLVLLPGSADMSKAEVEYS